MPTFNEIILNRPDPVLSQIAIGWTNQDAVGTRLAPVIPVQDRKGQFPKWGMESFVLPGDTIRAPRTKADAADFRYTWLPYQLEEHARDFEYEEKERQEYAALGRIQGNNSALFNLERDGVQMTEDQLQLGRENKISTILRSNAVPGETVLSGSYWSLAGTDIPAKARYARAQIRAKTGKIMNTVLLPFDIDEIIMWHPTMQAFLGDATRQFVDDELLRRVFRVENIIRASMIYNVGTEASPDLRDLWGKDVIFAYVDPNPQRNQRTQSLAWTFRYARTNNEEATPSPVQGQDQSMPVTAWYDPNTETHIRRVKYEEKTQIVSPNCGYVFRGVIA